MAEDLATTAAASSIAFSTGDLQGIATHPHDGLVGDVAFSGVGMNEPGRRQKAVKARAESAEVCIVVGLRRHIGVSCRMSGRGVPACFVWAAPTACSLSRATTLNRREAPLAKARQAGGADVRIVPARH